MSTSKVENETLFLRFELQRNAKLNFLSLNRICIGEFQIMNEIEMLINFDRLPSRKYQYLVNKT